MRADHYLPLPPHFQPVTIPALLRARAAATPDTVAVVSAGDDSDDRLTFRELDEASDALAAALLDRGLDPGSTIAWSLDNRHGTQAITLFHGVLKAGMVNVPLNSRLTLAESTQIASHARVGALIGGDRDAIVAVGTRLGLPDDRVFCLPDSAGRLTGHAPVPPPEAHRTDLASILYTSGTTGLPKGVEHTHESSLAAGIGWADAFRLGADDVVQSPFPVFGGAALHFNALAAMWAGGRVVFDSTAVGDALMRIARERATVYVAVPSIYQYWLHSAHLAEADLTSLRILDYGGASMPLPIIERLREVLPSVGLMQTYGLTEAGPGGTYLPEEYATSKLGSLGSRGAGPFTTFRVVRDDGSDVAANEVGELVLRGPSVMRGYHRDEAATDSVFTADGWLRSGDLVRLDSEGFAYLVDRKKDLIVRGGYNISSIEVEDAIMSHPDVVAAAAFGVPHHALGETVTAAVVVRPGREVTGADVRDHLHDRLASFKIPATVHIVADLPRNAAGKVLKRELTVRYATS